MTHDVIETVPLTEGLRREVMLEPDEVPAMVRLRALGWGSRRIAVELGCSRTTVRRWLEHGGWRRPPPPARPKMLDGLKDWVEERFRRHAGNADVVRQELAAGKGIAVGLRTVARAVVHLRQAVRAEARATVRFETRPGQQLQIDFGQRRVEIGGVPQQVSFFVATLGYSRRVHVRAFAGDVNRRGKLGLAQIPCRFDGRSFSGDAISAFLGRRRWVVGRSVLHGGLNPPGLVVEHRSVVDGVVEGSGRVAGTVGRCPECGTSSSSCHSRYVRSLSDLPISGAIVKVRLSVRRFRCKLASCRRKTFNEALAPGIGRRHGRRVARCDELVHAVGLALGGRPGSRMMARLPAPWSRDTLLRAVRREAGRGQPHSRGDGDRH